MNFAGFLKQQVNTQPFNARHGSHCFTLLLAFPYEYRVNEVVAAEFGLTHQPTAKFIMSHSAHTGGGKTAVPRWCIGHCYGS